MTKENPYRAFCEKRQTEHQFRQLRTTQILPDGRAEQEGKTLINFAGNDYLGLSRHPALIANAQDYAARYGAGSTASRLITGNHPLYEKIESKLAQGKRCESVLVMNSGYQANLTVLAALAEAEVIGRPVTILADRLCHNSLLQGALLSGARLMRYHHNDHDHLENLLRQQKAKGAHVIIVSESVFGMDGDCADLSALTALARQYDAMLYIDEAHATGLYGPNGFGFCAAHKGEVDIVMGTFGKALGSFGAYVGCSTIVRDYLIQRCGGLIYSTALPPSVLGAIEAALDLLPQMEKERAYLKKQSEHLHEALRQQGWNCGASTTHIIPVILGDEESATMLADILRQNSLLAPAIRPPTVPRGTSRLRLSLSAVHKTQDIDLLIDVMGAEAARFIPHPAQALAS
jgi:8-amino-7-oxononanoate synthase